MKPAAAGTPDHQLGNRDVDAGARIVDAVDAVAVAGVGRQQRKVHKHIEVCAESAPSYSAGWLRV
jgi:hypothetical protein